VSEDRKRKKKDLSKLRKRKNTEGGRKIKKGRRGERRRRVAVRGEVARKNKTSMAERELFIYRENCR